MLPTKAYAAPAAGSPLAPFAFERREPGPHDVLIEVLYCGVCHSDVLQARDEWGGGKFPMVPGHEVVGRVTKVGKKVATFKEGDLAGVGCMVDSCRSCNPCKKHLEQFCEAGCAWTYNSTEMDKQTLTYGGYSTQLVAHKKFVLKLPGNLDLAAVAPLLCAGITTWSPLKHWKTGKGDKVAVVGLGGLGHMAVKLAASLGAEVTVLSTSRAKEADAKRLGAQEFEVTSEEGTFTKLKNRFDLIIDTISAPHDYNQYLGTVQVDGAMVLLGVPPAPTPVAAFSLISGRRTLAGSLIGGVKETQELLDHCGKNNIVADIELIPMDKINEAYDRMMKGDVRYRFVIDCKTIG
jgi:uncharacterized zinc-type alcohol dehydrogenase-like protein